ncbi:hypothetical protein NLU13_1398 [Sarocladium strictum]|uniref:Uncharacterized protein n=1 Tax=Sarocladium strictum TaxID=5046 RepID=A0AA39GQW7_SARSR|nr:hypothetical protein NLU13_1398 [Sarocladium strictum]
MEDTTFAWPSYKFGFKHSDLSTTLHDKYNTFTSTIQDPEAFHHDVWEISNEATTTEDFHRLMAERRDQRMQELNDTLETLAVEIISNPKLLDSKHWKYALQLFRTRSFDSIVRYFASYLPDDYDDHHAPSSASSSFSEAHSEHTTHTTSTASSVDETSFPTYLDDHHDGPVMTEEPCSLDGDENDLSSSAVGAPLSPPESEPFTDQRSVSDVESRRSTNPPSRSMSFSGSESGAFIPSFVHRSRGDDDTDSMSDECDTAAASLTDGAESHASLDSADHDQPLTPVHDYEDDEYDIPPAQFPEDAFDALDPYDTLDSDTPTPRQETIATSYVEYKSAVSRRLPSPHRRPASPKPIRADGPHLMVTSRRSPEESASKIQKPSYDASRQRYKGRLYRCLEAS